jgi:hypothetical protein
MKQMKVAQMGGGPGEVIRYVVTEVKNSVTPKIYQDLSEQELQPYCDDDDWDVVISLG